MNDIRRVTRFTTNPDTPLLCRWHFHAWQIERDTGLVVYEECACCSARRARQVNTWADGRPVVIDEEWLATGLWAVGNEPEWQR